jgi:DNA-binding beta-propeller fold protein YncE
MPGHELFRMDATTGEVDARVMVSEAPHGVVVSADGATVWTSTLGMATVDQVDARSLVTVSSTVLGGGPNGISLVGPKGAPP